MGGLFMWNDSTNPATVCTAFPLLERRATVAHKGAIGTAGGGGGGGGAGNFVAAAGGAGVRRGAGDNTVEKGAGVTTSTTLSSAATCDFSVVSSPRRNLTVSTRVEMESVWCFSSLARITPKGLGLKFPA